ncbi:hypothetical protein L6164_019566 [Bauhinia variegata]|uniref:Uncharacterized protein n=1 Tax=Bauhinia variegata TaxID=167791 RepID=A0ACB9MU62_BAUVA|nr:hypothetical protein L6164_019566 [Bauhinia variegata]
MTSPSPGHRRKVSGSLISDRKLGAFPPEEHSDLTRRRTQFISDALPPSTSNEKNESLRLTKVLLNVTVENSLGPVQVFMSPEETVGDLVRAALVIYRRDRRRPFLKDNDPNRYDLHYSPFTLQSLRTNEKLINLGSRNFFLRSKPSTSPRSDPVNITIDSSAFPLMMFVHLLL